MKVLVATNQTQGWRENDFCWTVEDELVVFPPLQCGCGSIDDPCGCRRSMAGLVSHRATTTIKVVDRKELDPETYLTLISDGFIGQGYLTKELMERADVNEWLRDITDELKVMADTFPVGTVLERRDGFLCVRRGLTQPDRRRSSSTQ